jgi:hypothetical protein
LTPEPPDGVWLVDEQKREYFVVEVDRREGLYQWVNDEHTRVRLPLGLEFDLVSYDSGHFRVKIYRPLNEAAPVPARRPGAEEIANVAASYRVLATPGRGLTLQPFSAGLPERGQWRNGFDVADLDGDGHPDIVFGPPRKGRRTPTIFLGDGAGHWRTWRAASFPPLPLDYGDAAVADLNGDRIPDLVFASHLKGIVALIGDGRGSFTPWSRGMGFPTPEPGGGAPFTSRAIAITDWNGDGRPDIVAVGEGPQLARRPTGGSVDGLDPGSRGAAVLLNGGDGTWKKVVDDSRNFGGSLAVADFNRDGRMDFVVGSDRRGFTGLLNIGQPDGTWKATLLSVLRRQGLFRAVAAADFDGDGRPDLAVSFFTRDLDVDRTGIDVLLSREGGWERRTVAVVENRVMVYRLATGDLDGNGHKDLVGLDGDGALWILLGDGKGGFTHEPVRALKGEEKCQGYGLRLADLDGDGKDEIIVSFAEEPVTQGPYGEDLSCPSQGGLQAWKVAQK